VTYRGDAEFLQILSGEPSENVGLYRVLTKCLLVRQIASVRAARS